MDNEKKIKQLEQQVVDLIAANDELKETVKKQQETIADLQQTIKDLRSQLGMNSQNSSIPPSKDGFNKPTKPQSLRKKSGKKPGGQVGHVGTHMSIPHEPDDVKTCFPDKCKVCPRLNDCLKKGNVFACKETRYVVDTVVKTLVTEFQSLVATSCPYGETGLQGNFPESVRAYVQYGDSVSVLASLLNTNGAMSINRIHLLLSSMLGVSLSTGTIVSMISKCAQKVGGTLEQIKTLLMGSSVVNFDETGTNVNGKIFWVHNSSNSSLTYQTIDCKRGQDGMDKNGVLPNFHGVATHDCFSSYWNYDDIEHSICNAHILRELNSAEQYSPDHTWVSGFRDLLLAMKKAKERAISKASNSLSYYYYRKFDARYDELMKLADKECPAPPPPDPHKRGRPKKGKERSLIERLKDLKKAVCLFMKNFDVPFDNNQAERDVRNVKTKTKVSGCFRTKEGAQDYLDIMSYLSTGRKHNVNAYEALTAAFAGNAEIVLQ